MDHSLLNFLLWKIILSKVKLSILCCPKCCYILNHFAGPEIEQLCRKLDKLAPRHDKFSDVDNEQFISMFKFCSFTLVVPCFCNIQLLLNHSYSSLWIDNNYSYCCCLIMFLELIMEVRKLPSPSMGSRGIKGFVF